MDGIPENLFGQTSLLLNVLYSPVSDVMDCLILRCIDDANFSLGNSTIESFGSTRIIIFSCRFWSLCIIVQGHRIGLRKSGQALHGIILGWGGIAGKLTLHS
ncbi:hypothetical protein PMIN03_000907 [Paraphaeosphaeria minitans]